MHAGRVLATDTPANLVAARPAAELEEAFIAYLEEAEAQVAPTIVDAAPPAPPARHRPGLSLRRMMAYAHCEALAIRRDPVRLTVSLLGTVLLMLVFGYGITMDVERLTFAALDRDQNTGKPALSSRNSKARAISSRSRILPTMPRLSAPSEERPDRAVDRSAAGLRTRRDRRPAKQEVAAWIGSAMAIPAPRRSKAIFRGWVNPISTASRHGSPTPPRQMSPAAWRRASAPGKISGSIYAMVPSTIALLLVFIPAILMALEIVREKENTVRSSIST